MDFMARDAVHRRKFSRLLTALLGLTLLVLFGLLLLAPPEVDEVLLQDFSLPNSTFAVHDELEELTYNSSEFDDPATWKDLFSVPAGFEDIVESFDFLNNHHEVLNEAQFGLVSTAEVVVIVQVHNRVEYLRHLIASLQSAAGVEKALLVFSHDANVEEINELVRGIRFCRVIQIFYPFNIQIFPHVYPGVDPADCDPKSTVSEAQAARCKNWRFPDKYGHYRQATLSQIKHHWWWKINYVFDGILTRYGLNVYMVLLEEDHYVAPDFFHVLNGAIEVKKRVCPLCSVISMGLYLKKYNNFRTDARHLGVASWFSSKHNMGMAFNASTWQAIRHCAKRFCLYDDYNWDWTLLYVSLKCLEKRLLVMYVKAPRVIHVGECGVHTHYCGIRDTVNMAREVFGNASDVLFPSSLAVVETLKRTPKPSKENGGWGDIRDRGLCLANTYPFRQGTLLPRTLLSLAPILPPFDRRAASRLAISSGEQGGTRPRQRRPEASDPL